MPPKTGRTSRPASSSTLNPNSGSRLFPSTVTPKALAWVTKGLSLRAGCATNASVLDLVPLEALQQLAVDVPADPSSLEG